jgi:hypothetical protein
VARSTGFQPVPDVPQVENLRSGCSVKADRPMGRSGTGAISGIPAIASAMGAFYGAAGW